MKDLPSHQGKVTSNMNLAWGNFKGFTIQVEILVAIFLLNFESTIKYIPVSISLTLPKVGVDKFTWPWQESAVRKDNDL